MSDRNNVTLEAIADILREKERFLILCHVNPDEDTVGSGFALFLALESMGKDVRIACESLPTRRSGDYVDRDVFDTVDWDGGFDTALAEGRYIISVDVASRNMLGLLRASFEERVDLKIDHHAIGDDFGKLNYIDENAAACGEILYRIIDMLGAVTPEVASCLYLAVSSDTGGFRYSNTTADTHRIAGALIEKGADAMGVSEILFETKTAREFRAIRLGITNMRYFCDGLVALITVSNADKEQMGLDDDDLGELASISRQTEGVLVGIVLKQTDGEPRRYKISARSREGFDVAALCQHFGGGGHIRAAGGSIYADSMKKAEKQLLDVLYPMIGDAVG